MNPVKSAVKISSAAVMPQVALRFGQRTCLSSNQAPLKYAISLLKKPCLASPSFVTITFFGVLTFADCFLVTGLSSLALMRVTLVFSGLLFDFATTIPQIKSLLVQTVKYQCTALLSNSQVAGYFKRHRTPDPIPRLPLFAVSIKPESKRAFEAYSALVRWAYDDHR